MAFSSSVASRFSASSVFKSADGRDIVAGLFLQAALADAVGFGYSEVARGEEGGFRVGVAEDDSCGRASVSGSVHSSVASSHAS